jgi:hypothetical protein
MLKQVRVPCPQLIERPSEEGVELAQPLSNLLPHGKLSNLPQLDARNLLEQKPLTPVLPIGNRGRTGWPDAGRREESAIALKLASGFVQERRLYVARIRQEAVRREILEDELHFPALLPDADLL